MAKTATPFDPAKQFVKTLEQIAYNRSVGERFNDFLELAYCAVAKQMAIGERAEKLEERYMQTVRRHKPDDIRRIPELLGLVQIAAGAGGCDFLGKVSSELSVLNLHMGQFFTPYDLSRMMAELSLEGVGKAIESQGFVTIFEPASGSGAMILAAADVIEKAGHDIGISMYVEANDVSDSAFKMTYLQLCARGIPACVRRMNTLSLEIFETAYTTAMPRFMDVRGEDYLRWKEQARLPARERESEARPTALLREQLSFFDLVAPTGHPIP